MKTPFLLVLCLATIVMGADPPPATTATPSATTATPSAVPVTTAASTPVSGNSTSGPAGPTPSTPAGTPAGPTPSTPAGPTPSTPAGPTPAGPTPSGPATGNSSYIYGGPGCDSKTTSSNKCLPTIKDCNPFNVVLSSTSGLAAIPRVKYNYCAATADSKTCCTDECGSKKDVSSCLKVNPETCVWMQASGSMGCWHKQKLCTIYTTRPDICVKIEYCYWVATNQTTQYCAFKKPLDNLCPFGTGQVITADESVCGPAMPPWVVAVMVLTGLAMAAGIGMITTVIIKKKIKDKEEEAKRQARQGKM